MSGDYTFFQRNAPLGIRAQGNGVQPLFYILCISDIFISNRSVLVDDNMRRISNDIKRLFDMITAAKLMITKFILFNEFPN